MPVGGLVLEAQLATTDVIRLNRWNWCSWARWGVIAILAWSAGGKLFWPSEFRANLVELAILPPSLLDPAKYTVPIAELLVAASLATRTLSAAGLMLSFFLGTIFCGIHLVAIVSGTAIPCGCIGVRFSTETRAIHAFMLILSAYLSIASALLLLFNTRENAGNRLRDPVIHSQQP